MKADGIISTLRAEIRENAKTLRNDLVSKAEFFEFRKEMLDFRNEILDFRNEMLGFQDETQGEIADLHDTDNRIITELFDLKDRVTRIEENMATKDDIRRLETSMDGLTTIVKKMDNDRYALIEWLKRHDIQLEGLTTRVAAFGA